MSGKGFRLRVKVNTHEVDIEGSEEFVGKYWSELRPLLSDVDPADVPQPTVSRNQAPETPQQVNGELPDNFGQYLSTFGDLNQVEQALVAGHYHQEVLDDDSSFTTAGINKLLLEQGVKLTNASDCIGKNRDAKRVFNVSKGTYRVSKTGKNYIEELISRNGEDD